LVELDEAHPALTGLAGDRLLDAWVFSGQSNPVRRVVVGGREVVRDGRHLRREAIAARFIAAMRRLAA
jgi:formimidoylglutamate deiminase